MKSFKNIFNNNSLSWLLICAVLFSTINYLKWSSWYSSLIIIAGLLLGWVLFYLFKIIFIFISSSSVNRIKLIEIVLDNKKRNLLVEDIFTREFEEGSIVYSVVMYVGVLFLGLYVQFANGNLFAMSLIIGLIFVYIYQQFRYYFENHHLQGWFWQIKFGLPNVFYSFWLICQVIFFIVISYFNFY